MFNEDINYKITYSYCDFNDEREMILYGKLKYVGNDKVILRNDMGKFEFNINEIKIEEI